MTNPVPGRSITTPYGKKGSAWATGEHGGADWAAPTGTPVVAAWGGTVIGVRTGGKSRGTTWGSAYGNQIVVDQDPVPGRQGGGLWAVYAHLSRVSVDVGDKLRPGQEIGAVGNTGNATGPHLHYEVQTGRTWARGAYTNPQPWIDAQGDNDMGVYYDYSGKPGGTLPVGRDYKYLDIDEWDPPKAGLEHVMTYLNCSGFVFTGNQPGRIRVCFERNTKESDRFGHGDFTVVPGQEELLITHATFEKGDGTRTWTMIKCLDGLQSMVIGTRYMKRAVVV